MIKYEEHILKIQRPLFGPSEVLVYNQERHIMAQMPFDPEDIEELFGDEDKQYWLAKVPVNKPGMIKLIERVDEQDW